MFFIKEFLKELNCYTFWVTTRVYKAKCEKEIRIFVISTKKNLSFFLQSMHQYLVRFYTYKIIYILQHNLSLIWSHGLHQYYIY